MIVTETTQVNGTILGCGYVGTAVARLWRQRGLAVTATTTTPERTEALQAVANRVVVVRGNDGPALASVLADQHTLLIAVAGGRQADYRQVYQTTAETVVALLPQLPNLSQIIFTSTYSVYGDYQGRWVSETDPAHPATANGEILLATEQRLLAAATPQRAVCVFRLGGIYGPNRELARIYGRSAGQVRPGSGSEASNWIHLDDIAAAIDFAQQQHLSGLYNLVQDDIPTVRDLIDRVSAAHNFAPPQWDPTQPSRRPYNLRASNYKLKKAGFQFRHPRFELG